MRTMRWTTAIVLTLLTGSGASAVVLGQRGKTSDTPVTAIINAYDSGVAPSLQIQPDTQGTYVGSNTLTSLITSTGVWTLDAYNNAIDVVTTPAQRTVALRFTEPVAGSGPGAGGAPVAPAVSEYYKAWLYSSCNHFGNNPLTLTAVSQAVSCPMAVRFDANGIEYIIHMNGGVEQPETNPVTFTCLSVNSTDGKCKQWRIYPSGSYIDGSGATRLGNVARLSRRSTSKGKTTVVSQGNFYMSFSIIVMK
jgi:hypothetical protein